MFKRNFVRLACLTVVVMGLLFLPATPNQATNVAAGQMALSLQAPPFVNIARAAQPHPAAFDLSAYLDQEVGISAYYKSPDAITLSQVRSLCITIELEPPDCPDCIICSMHVPNYAEEHFDVHVYVHTSGWILAYYLRPDPISKIIDVRGQTIDSTKLKSVVSAVASAAGAPFTDVTYYDFRYPNATNMLLVAEQLSNGNEFTIKLPSTYYYWERGWAVKKSGYYGAYFRLDGVDLPAIWSGSFMYYGTITASQLLPDVTHTILVDDYGVLVIVYRVLP